MATHFITGKVGGGKSYYGAEIAMQVLREGGVVHTNLPLVQEQIDANGWTDRVVWLPKNYKTWVRETKDEEGLEVWESDIFVMGQEGAENVILIDESGIQFSADDQAKEKEAQRPFKGLSALCRHGGLDLYFLSQDKGMVSAGLRKLASTTTHCTNVDHIPIFGPLLKPFLGQFRRDIYHGNDPKPYGSMWVGFKKEVGTFYKTHGMRDRLKMKTGGARVKKASAWTQKGLIGIFGALAFALWLIGDGIGGLFGFFGSTESKPDPKASSTLQTKTRVNDDGTTTEVQVLKRPPAPPGGLIGIEWDPYDEHIISGQRSTRNTVIIYVRGGRKLTIGAEYEGQRIVSMFRSSGWWYFITDAERVIVARPLRPEERDALPPLTIPGPDLKGPGNLLDEQKDAIGTLAEHLQTPL